MATQTPKKETVDQNTTGTDLQILINLEKAWSKANGGNSKRNTEASMKFFSQYVGRSYNRVGSGTAFRDRKMWKGKNFTLGKMYFFEYANPVHKETLPIYDVFPLCVFFDAYRSKAGHEIILGLNFHFLKPVLRMAAFRALLKFKTENRYRKNTRLDFSWSVIKVLAQHKLFEKAVHAYRVDHLTSVLVEIPAQSWEIFLFLPYQKFVSK